MWINFPSEWKKKNFVPFHKKMNSNLLKTNRPINLLPICGQSCCYKPKIYDSMSLFFAVIKIAENLANESLVNLLEQRVIYF